MDCHDMMVLVMVLVMFWLFLFPSRYKLQASSYLSTKHDECDTIDAGVGSIRCGCMTIKPC